MDPTRDNPIIRFNTFWWALWAFFAFAIVLALVMIFNRKAPTNLEDALATARYKTQQTVAAAQTKELPAAEIDKVIPAVAAKLAASKPAAVERPEQVVPDSPSAKKLTAEPALGPTTAPVPAPAPVPVPAKPAEAGAPTPPKP